MKFEYINEDTGESQFFYITFDYCTIEGATFVASSEDGVHEVDGKGHDADSIKEQLDDYFWEKSLVENGVLPLTDCHYEHRLSWKTRFSL